MEGEARIDEVLRDGKESKAARFFVVVVGSGALVRLLHRDQGGGSVYGECGDDQLSCVRLQ